MTESAISTDKFARSLQGVNEPSERLQRGVELVVQLVEGCDHAGVMVASRRSVSTEAATDDLVRQGDAWQYELGEGPCLDSVREQQAVISQDLRTETRWTRWTPRVVEELGVRGMLSLLLYTEQETIGALNLYANEPGAWDSEQFAVANTLAGHLAVAFGDAREIKGRGLAVVNRTVIGQAEGILMERFNLTEERAFDYLRRASQASNRKLISVAEELVATRKLPQ